MLRTHRRRLAVVLATLLVAASCSNNDNLPPEPKYNAGTVNATIAGVAHQSVTVITLADNGSVEIRGTAASGRELHLHLAPDAGVGVVQLGGASNSYGEYTLAVDATWLTDPAGNTGTITVTSRTSKRVAGTFSFTLFPLNATNRTNALEVVNGRFDVAL